MSLWATGSLRLAGWHLRCEIHSTSAAATLIYMTRAMLDCAHFLSCCLQCLSAMGRSPPALLPVEMVRQTTASHPSVGLELIILSDLAHGILQHLALAPLPDQFER